MERIERGEHRTANPSSILPVKSSSDEDLCFGIALSESLNFVVKSKIKVLHERGTTSQHDVVIELDL